MVRGGGLATDVEPQVERAVRGVSGMTHENRTTGARRGGGFTLLELMISIGVIVLLVGILFPFLGSAREHAKSTTCMANLRSIGQGMTLYANENEDAMVPGRMPKPWKIALEGGTKYRPTFLAMLRSQVGIPAFKRPLDNDNPNEFDDEGQPSDRQNYAGEFFVCPIVRDWTDERNGSYGYNYQFLGNARLRDEDDLISYKNWTVPMSHIRSPSGCVAVGDSMGTAASFPPNQRAPYEDNPWGQQEGGRSPEALGNEGFNLDPPRIHPTRGEMADPPAYRSAIHERHNGRAMVLWLDGHATPETLLSLGYEVLDNGVVGLEGNNTAFSDDHSDRAWTR
jgi:prepilin-type processing-associated H-X9-DG protein